MHAHTLHAHTMTWLVIIGVIAVYGVLHAGHRSARRRGERGISVYWNSASRRPYVSIPLPFGFRIGHKL